MIKIHKILFFFYCFPLFISHAQKLEFVCSSSTADSSFYDICKVSNNEFWLAGEHGVLKIIDSSLNIKSIFYCGQGKSIYKILRAGNYIYMAADNGTILKFDVINKKLVKTFIYKNYKNHCFYDIMMLKNGKLIVCGGKNKIVKTKLILPSGFIMEVDTSFAGEVKTLWKSRFNFVWSMAQKDSQIFASTFNGRVSKILMSENGKFKKRYKIIGLAHKIEFQFDTLWLYGAGNIHFKEDGLIGKIFNNKIAINVLSGKGCVWSMYFGTKSNLAFTNNGSILKNKSSEWVLNDLNLKRRIYDTEQFNKNCILMVGNGKTIALLKNF